MKLRRFAKKSLIVPAIALGVLVLVVMVKSKQPPERTLAEETARTVRTVPVPEAEVIPRALGYGLVEPAQNWQAVAEVGGRIVEMHPDLEKGALLPEGAVLFRIDPEEYGLAETQGQADVASIQAQLTRLEQNEVNLRRSLAVELEALALAQAELARKRQLAESGTIAQSELDAEEQIVLGKQTLVQNIRNELALIPAEQEQLEAQLASAQAGRAGAVLDVERTTVTAPFPCRISDVNVELYQYAAPNQVLASASDIRASEVEAQVAISSLRRVLTAPEQHSELSDFSMDILREYMDVTAVVRFELGDKTVEWDAQFSRLSDEVDPETRTMGVFVTVEDSYLQAEPGERPPLIRNMYCSVELRGRPTDPMPVIPRTALHQDQVYIVNGDNRLELRTVHTKFEQGGLAAISSGLEPGELVVVTDLIPAVEGMLLSPVMDDELLEALLLEAAGEASIR